jgi:hypothetical protein
MTESISPNHEKKALISAQLTTGDHRILRELQLKHELETGEKVTLTSILSQMISFAAQARLVIRGEQPAPRRRTRKPASGPALEAEAGERGWVKSLRSYLKGKNPIRIEDLGRALLMSPSTMRRDIKQIGKVLRSEGFEKKNCLQLDPHTGTKRQMKLWVRITEAE